MSYPLGIVFLMFNANCYNGKTMEKSALYIATPVIFSVHSTTSEDVNLVIMAGGSKPFSDYMPRD